MTTPRPLFLFLAGHKPGTSDFSLRSKRRRFSETPSPSAKPAVRFTHSRVARRATWSSAKTNELDLALSPKGLGGTEVVKPRCVPGICFREDMCVETAEGVECGPCPDGYTGDGFNCDDVDEVRTVFLRRSSRKSTFHIGVPGYRAGICEHGYAHVSPDVL